MGVVMDESEMEPVPDPALTDEGSMEAPGAGGDELMPPEPVLE
jgi:hypothetical protein